MAGLPLVTGATGFAGGHLLERLLAHGAARRTPGGIAGGAAATPRRRTTVGHVDGGRSARSRAPCATALDAARPSVIYHCAGRRAIVQDAWRRRRARCGSTSSARTTCSKRRASSACVPRAGHRVGAGLPAAHAALTRRRSDRTGESVRREQAGAGDDRRRRAPMPAWLVRPFNHAGPRQSPAYVTSASRSRSPRSRPGAREPVLRVGNLDARRDITDVRDTVRAYRRSPRRGQPRRPYNVCSGRAYTMRDLLDILLSLARVPVRVESRPGAAAAERQPVVARQPRAADRATPAGRRRFRSSRRSPTCSSTGAAPRMIARRRCTSPTAVLGNARQIVHIAMGGVRAAAALDPVVAGGRRSRRRRSPSTSSLLPRARAANLYRPGERERGVHGIVLLSARGAAAARAVPAAARHRRRGVGHPGGRRRHRDAGGRARSAGRGGRGTARRRWAGARRSRSAAPRPASSWPGGAGRRRRRTAGARLHDRRADRRGDRRGAGRDDSDRGSTTTSRSPLTAGAVLWLGVAGRRWMQLPARRGRWPQRACRRRSRSTLLVAWAGYRARHACRGGRGRPAR